MTWFMNLSQRYKQTAGAEFRGWTTEEFSELVGWIQQKIGLGEIWESHGILPIPREHSSPQTRLGWCFSDLFLQRVHVFSLHLLLFFPLQSPFQNTEIYILKNINTSHCNWIDDCFAQPPAGKASSPTCSQKRPFSLLELVLTKQLPVLSICPAFRKRRKKKENFWWLAHGHHPAGRTQTCSAEATNWFFPFKICSSRLYLISTGYSFIL